MNKFSPTQKSKLSSFVNMSFAYKTGRTACNFNNTYWLVGHRIPGQVLFTSMSNRKDFQYDEKKEKDVGLIYSKTWLGDCAYLGEKIVSGAQAVATGSSSSFKTMFSNISEH